MRSPGAGRDEQGAAAVVAAEGGPHGNPEWLLPARQDTKGVTGRRGLAPCERTANDKASWITLSSLLYIPSLKIWHGLTLLDGANMERISRDDWGFIPVVYSEFGDIFSTAKAEILAPHRSIDHAIDLEPDFKLPYGRIYNLSEFELRTLKAYIETNLANGFILWSSSSAEAPILFAKKHDGGLWLCVDYRALNTGTIKNRYPLPLISEMLDRLRGARIFTKLDLRNPYHLIRIKEVDKYKTEFQIRYGQFEYQVMPFGLTNGPPTFQAYIDDCLRPYINDFTVCYLDNILICSTNEKEQEDHIRKVLQRLQEFGLYCKAEKSQFGVSEVGFLGFIISSDGIGMVSDCISTIEDWPTPMSVRDIQVLLGFANFYRQFIRKYAKVTLPLTELLKKTETSNPPKTSQKSNKPTYKWEWTREAKLTFRKLKRAFTGAPILQHFDPAKPIIL